MIKEYRLLKKLVNKMSHRKMTRHHYNLGAICVDRKGQVLAVGLNSYDRTHPIMLNYSYDRKEQCYTHAEIAAVTASIKIPHTIIIARIGNSKKISLAKPCSGCVEFLIEHKIKKIYYTNDNGELVLFDKENYQYIGRKKI